MFWQTSRTRWPPRRRRHCDCRRETVARGGAGPRGVRASGCSRRCPVVSAALVRSRTNGSKPDARPARGHRHRRGSEPRAWGGRLDPFGIDGTRAPDADKRSGLPRHRRPPRRDRSPGGHRPLHGYPCQLRAEAQGGRRLRTLVSVVRLRLVRFGSRAYQRGEYRPRRSLARSRPEARAGPHDARVRLQDGRERG